MFCEQTVEPKSKETIDTLFIIGNGFDIWQGLDTRFSQFEAYYLAHRSEILKKLHIRPYIVQTAEGKKELCDVELLYGDIFNLDELDSAFWNDFEHALGEINGEPVHAVFGKEKRNIRRLKQCIRNSQKILQKAFEGWTHSIEIEPKAEPYTFGENCLFINFNYTDTLEKRFGIPKEKIFHIHGKANTDSELIFGHAAHPQKPEPMLRQFGGRFAQLYLHETLLYETDKHCADHIRELILFLSMHGVMAEDIQHIYVLGHGMGVVDFDYFQFLLQVTTVQQVEEKKLPQEEMNEEDALALRVEYAVEHTGYGKQEVRSECAKAVYDKFQKEEEEKDKKLLKAIEKYNSKLPENAEYTEKQPMPRTAPAQWHVSCFSKGDKDWIEHLFAACQFDNYKLYDSIPECLASFGNER